MATDEERRDVARRLRKTIGLTEFAEALGFNWTDDSDWGWKDVSNLVADLIEPPARCPHYMYPCCRTDAGGDYIDRDALLALADEMGRKSNDGTVNPDPMRPLATSLDLFGYARRIRKACGVVGRG